MGRSSDPYACPQDNFTDFHVLSTPIGLDLSWRASVWVSFPIRLDKYLIGWDSRGRI